MEQRDKNQLKSWILRDLPVYLWVVALYVVTAVTARQSVDLAPSVLEMRNIFIHFTGYAVGAVLLLRSRMPAKFSDGRPYLIMILGLTFLLGLGQEILQAVLREKIYLINSIFDICVDMGGAASAFYIVKRWRLDTANQTTIKKWLRRPKDGRTA